MRTTNFESEQERQSWNPRFNDKTTTLFEDDSLATEEYERVYHKRLLSPEQELAAAVLDEAVAEYQRYLVGRDKRSMKRCAEVEGWFLRDDNEWIFSYVNCCEILGIEPAYLRGGLLRWKQKKLSGLPALACTTTRKKIAKKPFRQAA